MKIPFSQILPIIILSIFAFSCKKKDDNGDANNGTFCTVKINGKEWTNSLGLTFGAKFEHGPGYTSDNNTIFTLQLISHDQNMIPVERLEIINMNVNVKNKKTYSAWHYGKIPSSDPNIHDTSFSMFTVGYADVNDDVYTVLEGDSLSNNLTIDSYDANTRRVQGHFNITMYRYSDTSQPPTLGYTDTLRFTDGNFNLIINK